MDWCEYYGSAGPLIINKCLLKRWNHCTGVAMIITTNTVKPALVATSIKQ
jgi:hypothetical protein